jgi:DHA1 family bicyclomycin/chloramphenicol resistance-like MFS transporter
MGQPRSITTIVVLLTTLVAIGPVSTDLYLPSLPSIGRAFAASVSATQLTLSVFIAGFAVGTLLYGPVSDRIGRRPALLAGMALFTLASLACAFAATIDQLIALRFVEAFGGCAGAVLSRAVVRDLFARDDAARILSYMAGAMALAPAMAPVIGGWVHLAFGWRGQFFVLAGLGAALTAAAWLLLGETNRHLNPQATDPARLLRNVLHLLRHRAFVGYALTMGFSYGGLFSFISGGAFVVIGVLGVAPENFGFLFVFVAGGFVAGALLGGRMTKRVGILGMMTAGVWLGLAAGIAGLALALLEVTAVPAVIAPVALVFFSCALVFPNATAGALGPFPDMAGTASSVASFIQMSMGAGIGALVGVAFDGTTVPLFAVIVASTSLAVAAFYGVVRRAEAPRS